MAQLSIGFDPAPPGKLELNKALCDSDFDGCVCAAILKTVYPALELEFADPGSVQSGLYNNKVDAKTVVADLPYVPGCGLYFDHHAGNKPDKPMPGRWQNSLCAASILYDYYKGFPGVERFAEVVGELGRFDGGDVKLEDIRKPNIIFDMGFAVDRNDREFHRYFSELLSRRSWSEVLQDAKVKEKLAHAASERQLYLDFIRKYTEIRSNVAFVDLKYYQGKTGHSYFVALQHPEIDGIVVIKHEAGKHKFTLFQNPFKADPEKRPDFLKIAKAINPKLSGGHQGSCGFTLPDDWTVAQGIAEIERAVQEQNANA